MTRNNSCFIHGPITSIAGSFCPECVEETRRNALAISSAQDKMDIGFWKDRCSRLEREAETLRGRVALLRDYVKSQMQSTPCGSDTVHCGECSAAETLALDTRMSEVTT